MKISTFLSLLIVSSLSIIAPLSITHTYAMDTQEEVSQEQRINLILQQASHIQEYASMLKNNNKSVNLVLGVNNGEEDLLERFDNTYVFLDMMHKNPSDGRSISVNFNDLSEMTLLEQTLSGQLDAIILDDSTFKFTTWSDQHLTVFRNMLTSNGRFIFGPHIGCLGISFDNDYETQEDVRDSILRTTRLETTMNLIISFSIPYKFPIIPQAYQSEISNLFEKYKQVRGLEEEEKWHKLEEMGINSLMSDSILENDTLLWEYLTQEVNQEKFTDKFFKEEMAQHNYKRILETVFGQENVMLEYDKSLPFESHWNEKQKVLITAIRKN